MAALVELDLTAHIPIYRQIADQLRLQIEAGELEAGNQLPTVRRLAEELQVNFNTVARAYRSLDEDGWISTQHGRGTFVLGVPDRQTDGAGSLRRLARRFAERAQRFGFSPEQVAREVGYVLEEWAQREGR